ncbi:MAG: hypothetical protein K6A69_04530 [Lachnospiraceae bacterium]|nr:hypothetical protein [Lachnospiraceae bacterium]
MQDILKEYGPALITVVAIIALVVLIRVLIGTDADSVVGKAFTQLMETFFTKATEVSGAAETVVDAGSGGL